ncbi:WD repeat-containing protein 63 [Argiope bruennichi]|uniref:WD repeat-containing protein 63 n=1 Tax=Argiope bruennichi TaxID=94029 RepID=A0A8T0E725_ARGBR|nr:WD repeat-containing protein 63 [Argiope bruennichi]
MDEAKQYHIDTKVVYKKDFRHEFQHYGKLLNGFVTPPIIRCCATSSMDHVHKYGISDLLWVPPDIEISAKGEIIKNAASGYQIITCGLDGFLHFWDLRMGFQSKPGNPFPKKFNHLNGTWEPFHSVEVFSQESRKRKSLTCFMLRNYCIPPTEDNGDITEDEFLKSEFYAGCDDGQILCGNFKLKRDESGKFITEQPKYFSSTLTGAVTVLTCSPFVSDIFLSAGGKTIEIWKNNIKSGPLYLRERNAYITSGQWSPTRPALFLLGFQDGSIEVWDLLSNLYQPSVIRFMSTSAITSVCIQSLTGNEHIVVAGDSKGVVYSMNLLPRFWILKENELLKVQQMIEKEANRILKGIQPLFEESKISEKIPEHLKETSKIPDDSMKHEVTDEIILANSYEEFLTLQEQELKNVTLNLQEDEALLSNEENE